MKFALPASEKIVTKSPATKPLPGCVENVRGPVPIAVPVTDVARKFPAGISGWAAQTCAVVPTAIAPVVVSVKSESAFTAPAFTSTEVPVTRSRAPSASGARCQLPALAM